MNNGSGLRVVLWLSGCSHHCYNCQNPQTWKGKIELVSPEGDRINLKSKLAQYFVLANAFSDGYIKELELVAYKEEDISRLIKFMYQGE